MSEVKLFCTDCWHEVRKEDKACPYCGGDLSVFDELTYDEKLIKALMHFEAQTAVRAAKILAMRKSKRAAGAIAQAFINRSDLDVVMGRAFIKAIAEINGEDEKVTASTLKNDKFRSEAAGIIIEDSLSPMHN